MIKRIYIFSLVLFLVSMQTFAQVRFGIKAGFNLANMTDKDRNGTYSNDYMMKEGFHLGVTAEYSISNNFSFEPGLLYSSKGSSALYFHSKCPQRQFICCFIGCTWHGKGSRACYPDSCTSPWRVVRSRKHRRLFRM